MKPSTLFVATAQALLAMAVTCHAAHAQTLLTSTVTVEAMHYVVGVDDPFSASDYLYRENSTPFGRLSGKADSDYNPQAYHGFSSAWSQVEVGGLHVFAQGQSVAGGDHLLRVTSKGTASGFMSDFFRLSVPGAATGASFTVTAQVNVTGSAFAQTSPGWTGSYQPAGDLAAFSHWESWVRVMRGDTGQNLVELRSREDCDERTAFGNGPFCRVTGQLGVQTISFQMLNNGTAVQLDMRGWASAGTSIYQPRQLVTADSFADLGNSITWGGISELRDANGQLVSNFAAISATSGFDYRSAYVSVVPEAPGSLMLLAGLAMLGVARRRGLDRSAR